MGGAWDFPFRANPEYLVRGVTCRNAHTAFYFEGCPSWEQGLGNLQTALREEGVAERVETVLVSDDAQARKLRFPGSPTFRVDGRDPWPTPPGQYSLSCRIYRTPQGLTGFPTVAMIREALRRRLGR